MLINFILKLIKIINSEVLNMKWNLLTLLLLVLSFQNSFSQVFTNKEVGKKNQDLADSLKKSDYPYALPIWGDKATKAGYSLPYSAGFSVQYFASDAEILIDNLMVGFNNGPMYDLDEIVRFNESIARANTFTVRPDIWLFPFLNVYGILGTAHASTDVNFGIWVPDSTGESKEVFSTGTEVEFTTTAFGLGVTPTIGVGGGFLALDLNVAWADVPQLSKPTRSFVFGPRFGKSFKLKKPEQTFAVWAGGFRVSISSETDGSLDLSEVFPEGGSETSVKIDNAILEVEDKQQQVDAWWVGLSQADQNNPINKAKYETANSALDRAGEILYAADNAMNTISNSTVQYSMDKALKDAWNFIVGGQFQFNKHLMIRGEFGFLGSRTQIMGGVQYRFGL
jgi:hypothetical protein